MVVQGLVENPAPKVFSTEYSFCLFSVLLTFGLVPSYLNFRFFEDPNGRAWMSGTTPLPLAALGFQELSASTGMYKEHVTLIYHIRPPFILRL
jgi:hypothetical protein